VLPLELMDGGGYELRIREYEEDLWRCLGLLRQQPVHLAQKLSSLHLPPPHRGDPAADLSIRGKGHHGPPHLHSQRLRLLIVMHALIAGELLGAEGKHLRQRDPVLPVEQTMAVLIDLLDQLHIRTVALQLPQPIEGLACGHPLQGPGKKRRVLLLHPQRQHL
jgi:hypothetical protein